MDVLENLEKMLGNVLSVLEKIDIRLKQQEERAMENRSRNRDPSSTRESSQEKVEPLTGIPVSVPTRNRQNHINRTGQDQYSIDPRQQSKKDVGVSPEILEAGPTNGPSQMLRGSYGSPPLDERRTSLDIEKRDTRISPETAVAEVPQEFLKDLGNAWAIPEDDRVPLAFSKRSLLNFTQDGQNQVSYSTEVKKRIQKICDYNSRLSSCKKLPHTDWNRRFQIFDYYPSIGLPYPTSYAYNIRHDGKNKPFYVETSTDSGQFEPLPGQVGKRPWRRIILCQGPSSMQRVPNEHSIFEPCQFFDGSWFSYIHGYMHHLELSQESTSYEFKYLEHQRSEILFQLLYFDYLDGERQSENEVWPHGTFYRIKNARKDLAFRKAAFTIFARKGADNEIETPMTVVIYSASDLYKKSENVVTAQDFGSFAPTVAIFSILLTASWTIGLSWKRLELIMQTLVSQDEHSFMNPDEYVKLMYDDAKFSRSKLYFWAIGTLSEFRNSLAQYIAQLELFYQANIEPVLREPVHHAQVIARIRELDKDFHEHLDGLRRVRRSFEDKLVRVQGLQDALFTGSSVMEARQSRVLGENVQLLTFVSIFFLPLGFAMALWAVPAVSNKHPDTNALIYASCIIAGVSYLVIFNLKRLIRSCQNLFGVPAKALGRGDDRFPRPEALPTSKWCLAVVLFIKCYELIPWRIRSQLRRNLGWSHLKRIWEEVRRYGLRRIWTHTKLGSEMSRIDQEGQPVVASEV